MQHDPVELRASPEALLALTKRVTGYLVEHLPGGTENVSAVWFQADRLYLVSAYPLGLARKFEVFPLVVQTPAEVLAFLRANAPLMEKAWAEMRAAGIAVPPMAPPVAPVPTCELQAWPFQSWRIDVLKRMEFIVGPEHLPEDMEGLQEYFRNLRPGEAPEGSEHTCLAVIGLLFTSTDGRRFLIVADGTPGWMRVTDDEETVQDYLRRCIVVPAAEYVSVL